jgi:hypothetical protein
MLTYILNNHQDTTLHQKSTCRTACSSGSDQLYQLNLGTDAHQTKTPHLSRDEAAAEKRWL